ncbi:TonB-dependent receptor [Membranicola marinus]|uniref:TonB-dependent receptor n=1 Tax=Membranihabitans marinus TaxID=1227546 RepID=A0A953HWY7_9BACT|nr:TonB-dependent receptor [Membranihabitans marinus]
MICHFRNYQKLNYLNKIKIGVFLLLMIGAGTLSAQTIIRGKIVDAQDGEPLIGANVRIENTEVGTVTDWDGVFRLETELNPPLTLILSYVGYENMKVNYAQNDPPLNIAMNSQSINLGSVVIKSERLTEKQKTAPLTVESLDLNAIKETASTNFYDGLGALKGVDLTAASLGFKIINTRGFNSTSPVRSLQIIDGVDNQAPGLNFSLGNFLGSSELDVRKVDIIVGASSAYYGPNAFNGVISMETKDPFFHHGLSAYVKGGERNMLETAVRWGHVLRNDQGDAWMAYKMNFSFLRADDWEAENYNPVFDTEAGVGNPGGYDAVNIYGDEYYPGNDLTTAPPWRFVGMGIWHRRGYKETDLVDYDTKNIKGNVALHFRTNPDAEYLSPEIIVSSSLGNGTTVYQGDNRFSLRNILFLQNRLEFKKKDKYFLRAYMTIDDAGDSFDPYFTALRLQEQAKDETTWSADYTNYYRSNYAKKPVELGYPELQIDVDESGNIITSFDRDAAQMWLDANQDLLKEWHQNAQTAANQPSPVNNGSKAFYEPGTDRFREVFQRIISRKSNSTEKGTRFYDKSALYHLHGEYKFEPTFLKSWTVGGNARQYRPDSDGTIFYDSAGVTLTNFEFGIYSGLDNKWGNREQWTTTLTMRLDKNENFNWLFSPAASVVYQPKDNTYLRLSFSSAIRNPTLSDQFLDFNVGRAILSGNLHGVDSLISLDSFDEYRKTLETDKLSYFSIDPIQPESVKTVEAGVRTSLWNKWYLDAGYYYSIYNDFIGYKIGLKGTFDAQTGLTDELQAYRYSANSTNQVTTQGASIGLNYYLNDVLALRGNYSWNKLNKAFEDDPIIPAFNTPEHKFNLGVSGRKMKIPSLDLKNHQLGFNINYKWIEGFLFEGSPQFTGIVPTYDLLDVQINWNFINLNTTIKIGASNVLNNQKFQTYGGPRIGRLGYITILYGN